MFFLSPEEQAAKDAEEARKEALYEANRNSGGIRYAPVGQKVQADINTARIAEEERKARERAETIKRMEEENIQWAKDNDLWDYENNRVIPDNKPIKETFVEKQFREEEERRIREQIYHNEERSGMAYQNMPDIIDKDLIHTSYFSPENKAQGDTRSWEEIKEDFLSGKDDGPVMHNPYLSDSLNYRDKVLAFKYGDAFTNRDKGNTSIGYNVMGVPDYYTNQYRIPYESPEGKDFVFDAPLTIGEAKDLADDFYIESLTRSLEKAETAEDKEKIQRLINKGAPTFNTKADFQAYYDLGVEVYQNKKELLDQGVAEADMPFSVQSELKDALQIQEDSMAAWIFFGDGRNLEYSRDQAHYFYKEDVADFENPFENGDVFYNTGTGWTAGSLSNYLKDPEFNVGTVKGQSYWFKAPEYEEPSDFQKVGNVMLDIVSIIAPQAAPIIQAGKVATSGGDLEDVIKAGVGTHLGNVISDIAGDKIVKTYDNLGIPVGKLSEVQQKVIVDTTRDVLQGKSAQDSLEKNAGKALVKGGVEAVGDILKEIDIEMGDFETPKWLEQAGDVVVAAGTAIGSFVEPVVKPVYEAVKKAGDVVEPVAKDVLEVAQESRDVISDFTSDIEDDILDAGRAFDDSVIDPIDDALDTFGEKVVDPALQAGSDVLSEVEDGIKSAGRFIDDLIDWESLMRGLLGGSAGMAGKPIEFMPTETESLFGKELFKLKTKIEDPDSEFNPITKLRKYG